MSDSPCLRTVACLFALACASRALAADDWVQVGEQVPGARQPQAAVDAEGRVHVVFGSGNAIYHCRSDDGREFSAPVLISDDGRLALGMRRGPRLAVTRNAIVVTAIVGEQGMGRDGDLVSWRSTDGGATWEGPARANDVSGSAREGLHAMTATDDGQVFCTWLDLRHGKTEIFGVASDDDGATWGENRLVYRSPGGSVCECCHPSATFDGEGTLHVMWRNSLAGARDMYVASSQDGGQRFGKARKLGGGTWPLEACPMDGGMLAAGPKRALSTIWRREADVFVAVAGQKEKRLGHGEQPWAAASSRGVYLAWLEGRPGRLMVLAPGEHHPSAIAENALDPVLAARADRPGPVVALWQTGDRDSAQIMAQVLTGAE